MSYMHDIKFRAASSELERAGGTPWTSATADQADTAAAQMPRSFARTPAPQSPATSYVFGKKKFVRPEKKENNRILLRCTVDAHHVYSDYRF
jgi:hypothetical protein